MPPIGRFITAIVLLAAASCTAEAPPPLAASPTPTAIGFATVADARAALDARPDVTMSTRDGYDLFSDRANHVLWTFTRPGHAAYPSVVRREVFRNGAQAVLESSVLCQAQTAICDLLRENTRLLDTMILQELGYGSSQLPARAPNPAQPDLPAPPKVRI